MVQCGRFYNQELKRIKIYLKTQRHPYTADLVTIFGQNTDGAPTFDSKQKSLSLQRDFEKDLSTHGNCVIISPAKCLGKSPTTAKRKRVERFPRTYVRKHRQLANDLQQLPR